MNIKKMLKDGAKQVLPDEKIKQNIKYRMGLDGEQIEEVDLGGVKARRFSARKTAAIAAACLVGAAVIVCAFIPLMQKTSSTIPGGGIFGELSTAEEVYGFSAASAGMMIAEATTAESYAAGIKAVTARSTLSGQVNDSQTIELINGYMQLVESLISGGNFTVEGGANQSADHTQYEYVMRVSYTDILGENRDGGMIYYNRTLRQEETEDDEQESTYTLEGVMMLDGNEYPLYGTHKSETEDDESEDEYTMRITLGADSYMLVEQTHEREEDEIETEYIYSLYEGRKVVSRTTFCYEREEDETELVMTVDKSGRQQAFAFGNEDGRITIRVGGANESVTYTVKVENGQYVYFRGNSEVDREDRGYGHGRHDDDD